MQLAKEDRTAGDDQEPAGDSLAEAVSLLRDIRLALTGPRLDNRLAIDAAEFAAALGISERMIWTMDSAMDIPAPLKCGSRTLWNVAEIRKWIDAGSPNRDEWEKAKRRK